MPTLTYVKGLPTPPDEMNALGFTALEMFLAAYAPIFHQAACETTSYLLSDNEVNKSQWNTHLQQTYGINKRYANGVITFAFGAVDAAKEARKLHIKTLEGQLKSIEKWIAKSEKKLNNARKFYRKKKWIESKTGCQFPLSCSLEFRDTNWQHLRFQIHNKKRRANRIRRKLEHLKSKPIRVVIPRNQAFIVGSKDESEGNQVCQWDGDVITLRVPKCLESRFGQHVKATLGTFERRINRLPPEGAKTWHFFRKHGKWCAAVQFTPAPVKRVSRHFAYGCIGIDMNPGSIGWAYVDGSGNLKAHGQIPLQTGLPSGKQDATIVHACLQLAVIASTYACPIVCEELDFTTKKEELRERGSSYARMLSGWAYNRFYELLGSILSNRGIYLMTVNPAYTSLIGLVKFARMYGLASDESAALAIARRGMHKREKLPSALTAYFSVNEKKHVWHWWNQLNNLVKKSSEIGNRHDYYNLTSSNWESLVKQKVEVTKPSSKRKRDHTISWNHTALVPPVQIYLLVGRFG